MLSNEALWLLKGLIARTGGAGTFAVDRGPEAPLPGVKDLALRAERAANVHGAEMLGFTRSDDPAAGVRAGDVLVIAGELFAGQREAALRDTVARASTVIVLAPSLPAWAQSAAIVLPIANMSEEDGTFTNLRGRVQRYLQAKAAPGFTRPSFYVLGDLLAAMGQGAGYFTAAEAFAAMAAAEPAFAGMSYDTLGLKGAIAQGAMQGATQGATMEAAR
jgi:NADH-quinone oxidoreductase subunit G